MQTCFVKKYVSFLHGPQKTYSCTAIVALTVIKNKHNNNKINYGRTLIKYVNSSILAGVGRGYLFKVGRAAAKLKNSFIRKNENQILVFRASAIHLYSSACTGVTA